MENKYFLKEFLKKMISKVISFICEQCPVSFIRIDNYLIFASISQ